MRTISRDNARLKAFMNTLLNSVYVIFSIGILILKLKKCDCRRNYGRIQFTILDRIPSQMKNMSDMSEMSDEACRDQLRMDRAAFHKLCFILQSVCGLKPSRRVTVHKKVAMFLSILAHHTKNKCVKFAFKRFGQTVSKHFHAVLSCVLRMHAMLLVKPQPMNEDLTDPRWQPFQADPCVKGLRYKTWPYYPQWIEIFGKDRATGENAIDPIDLVNELYNNGLDREVEIGERYVSLTPDTLHDVEDNINRK
ncbi:hypothetical protein ACS0TY_034297 [Phlomoides rotata]